MGFCRRRSRLASVIFVKKRDSGIEKRKTRKTSTREQKSRNLLVARLATLTRNVQGEGGSGGGKKEQPQAQPPLPPARLSPYTPDATACKANQREFPADGVRRHAPSDYHYCYQLLPLPAYGCTTDQYAAGGRRRRARVVAGTSGAHGATLCSGGVRHLSWLLE